MSHLSEQTPVTRILRESEVEEITGISRNSRYRMSVSGEFPAPVWIIPPKKGGKRGARGYMSDEIEAWIESRRDKRSIRQEKPWKPDITKGATS